MSIDRHKADVSLAAITTELPVCYCFPLGRFIFFFLFTFALSLRHLHLDFIGCEHIFIIAHKDVGRHRIPFWISKISTTGGDNNENELSSLALGSFAIVVNAQIQTQTLQLVHVIDKWLPRRTSNRIPSNRVRAGDRAASATENSSAWHGMQCTVIDICSGVRATYHITQHYTHP